MIKYGWTWTGVYSYHVEMAPWVLIVPIALFVAVLVIVAKPWQK